MRLRTIAIVAAVLAALFAALAFAPPLLAPQRDAAAPADDRTASSAGRQRVAARHPALDAADMRVPVLPRASTPQPLQPLPKIRSRLVDIHDELRQRALNGDVRAACRLAFELQRCASLPSRRFMLDGTRQRAADEKDAGMRAGYAKALAFWGGLVEQAESTCEGFPPQETSSAWKWELAAAQAGYPPSMARFVSGVNAGAFGREGARHDGWNAYRDHAAEFLQRAVDAGEPVAFELAMHAHRRGQLHGVPLVPQDPVRAAAFSIALQRAASAEYAAYFDLAETARELGAERYAEAQRLSQALSARLARVPPGSVDFTNGTQGRDDGSHCERPPD